MGSLGKVTATTAIFIALCAQAFAASTDECEKGWSIYDVSKEGVLRGAKATQFYDDMAEKGIAVGKTENGEITAKQYMTACEKDFWEELEQ